MSNITDISFPYVISLLTLILKFCIFSIKLENSALQLNCFCVSEHVTTRSKIGDIHTLRIVSKIRHLSKAVHILTSCRQHLLIISLNALLICSSLLLVKVLTRCL